MTERVNDSINKNHSLHFFCFEQSKEQDNHHDMMSIQGGHPTEIPDYKEQPIAVSSTDAKASCRQNLCGWFDFEGCKMAKGYCLLAMGRGALLMSNIYLSASFVYLASADAGCIDAEGEVITDCDKKVYGMNPTVVVSNISVVSGLLSAFFMPLAGAMVDYTSHRRLIGRTVTFFIILIQAAQIATVSSTWFSMAILQGINGFLYFAMVLSVYAYLPDIARLVGEKTMPKFTSSFSGCLFVSSLSFLITIAVVAKFADLNDVRTGQLGQAVNTVWSGLLFWLGWKLMPIVPAANVLPEGRKSLLVQSFVQVWQTTKRINRDFKRGLRWFLLAIVFSESASAAIISLAVVFLSSKLGMNATAIGIYFIISLVGCIVGAVVSKSMNGRMNTLLSWRLSMLSLMLVATAGALLLTEETRNLSFVWGFFMGLTIGTYYPTVALILSMLLPKGQEAELSGFFVYSTQIIAWLPPLVFSGFVSAGVDQKYGLLAVSSFYIIAIVIVSLMAPWDECVKEAHCLGVETGPTEIGTTETGTIDTGTIDTGTIDDIEEAETFGNSEYDA